MEITTDSATSSKTEATKITSVEPFSDLNNCTIITIAGMEPEFYKAAVKGNTGAFEGKGKQIESILTPNKNTILHIHLTNYTDTVLDTSVKETFVEEVLGMCPALLLKTNVKGDTILHIAARNGHYKTVKKLIDCAKIPQIYEVGAEKRLIRAVNDKKDTALHEAARYGHNEVVGVLLKEELDHSYFGKNVDGETPLYIAVEKQYWNVVDTILDNSNSPQYNGPSGRTALHAAVLHGDAGVVRKLVTRNLSAAKQADENGWVPLHLAALCVDSDVVEELVSKDSSTAYMRDNKGRTALHFAALINADAVETILKYCPDCYELVDEQGSNALHYTAMGESCFLFTLLGHIFEVAPLIRNLCNEKDDDGNTPLHLLAHQAPEWKKDYDSYHPLLDPQLPDMFQFPKVDKMAFNKYGQTALDIAVDVVPPDSASENAMLTKLKTIGAKLGGRVLDKHLKEKKQEKRAVGGKEKQYTTNSQDPLTRKTTAYAVVATLIATVTFTAGFTLPGGLIQEGEHKGSPILKYNAAFIAFVVTDSLSFMLSISTVFFLFFISTIPEVEDEVDEEPLKFLLSTCMFLIMGAMAFMIIAFGTGIYVVLGVSKGFGIVTLFIVFSFFFGLFIVCMSLNRRVDKVFDQRFIIGQERRIELSQIL